MDRMAEQKLRDDRQVMFDSLVLVNFSIIIVLMQIFCED